MLIGSVIDFSFSKLFLQDWKIPGSINYLACYKYAYRYFRKRKKSTNTNKCMLCVFGKTVSEGKNKK